MRGLLLVPVAALVALAGALSGQATPVREQAAAQARFDTRECATCHEKAAGAAFLHSRHAGLEQGCESCHQGAIAHAQAQAEGKEAPGPSVKKLSPADLNGLCQGCHETTHNATWAGSAHQRRGVKCTDCHSVHDYLSPAKQLKAASDPEVCYRCHQAIRAQGLRTSHHPVREGLMTCASCHDPHEGSRPKMIRADYTNELCYQCHTEKRGPFLWEHAPVRENCLTCHNPHGSSHDKLLVSQQPWLCQRCHLNTRHPGTFYSGVNAGTSVELASNRAVEHACKNCHQNVHGGNAPSGPYLGR
jgi:DmsE family decaheme c-type cytochrome